MTDGGSARPFRKALLTGAAGGLGSQLARLLAADGVELILLDRNEAGLEALRAELANTVATDVCLIDLRRHDELEQRLRGLVERHGAIDLVIANAGIDHPMRMAACDWRNLVDHFATNVEANFVLLAVLVPRLLAQGGGHVAAISSLGGLAGFPYEAGYCASKAALSAFIESARAELVPKGITFTTIHPGFIDTAMLHGNAFEVPRSMTAPYAAHRIYRAIRARKPTLYFPRSTHFLILLSKLLPIWIRDRVARNAMKKDYARS